MYWRLVYIQIDADQLEMEPSSSTTPLRLYLVEIRKVQYFIKDKSRKKSEDRDERAESSSFLVSDIK